MSTVSKLQIVLEATTTAFDRGLKSATHTLNGFSEKVGKMHDKIDKFARQNKDALEGLRTAGAGAAVSLGVMTVGIKSAVDSAVKFEKAMAGVKKVVDFDTPQAFKQMEKDILAMSQVIPMSAEGLANIMAAAGQSGIAQADLKRFTETAAKMGIAFDITAEEAGQAMAEMRVAFKMSQSEVEGLADRINYLGNTTPNSAKKIMEVVQRVGSLGGIAGVSAEQITALAGSITAVEPDVAATGLKNLMIYMTKGASATKSQRRAFDELGLSAEQVAKNMQIDSMGTFLDVIERIKKLPKDVQVSSINSIFGTEALPIIAQYVDNTAELRKNLEAVADTSKYAGSMQKEFESMAGTSANQMTLFGNNVEAVKIALGTALLPAINSIMQSLTPFLKSMADFAQNNPEVVRTVVMVTGAVLGSVAALGGLSLAFAAVTSAAGSILSIGTMAITIFKGIWSVVSTVSTAMKVFSIAMQLAGMPMAPLIIAITALVAVGVLLYQNWDTIKAKASEVWNSIQQTISQTWENIKSYFSGVGEWFGGIWENIKTAVSTKIEEVKQAFNDWLSGMPAPVQEMVANIVSIFTGLSDAVNFVWSAIKTYAQSAWNGIVAVVGPVFNVIVGVVKSGIALITSAWSIGWLGLKTVASTAFDGVKAAVSFGINAIKAIFTAGVTIFASVFNTGFNLIKIAFTTAFNVIKALVRGDMNGVKNAISNGLSSAWNAVKTGADNIWQAFKGLGSKLLQAGRDAIQGFINGVKGKLTDALATARQMANQVISTVKSALDIHSPSREMKKLGGHTAEGLAVGIEKDAPKAVKAAKKMAEDTKKAVAEQVANLKREIALFGDDSPIVALKYDIKQGKYKGADTKELERLTAEKYYLERNKTVFDEINNIKANTAKLGMNNIQFMRWEYENTDKYKGVRREVFEQLVRETEEYDKQVKAHERLKAFADAQLELKKKEYLFNNSSDKYAEQRWNMQQNGYSTDEINAHVGVLKQQDALSNYSNVTSQLANNTAFSQPTLQTGNLGATVESAFSGMKQLNTDYQAKLDAIRAAREAGLAINADYNKQEEELEKQHQQAKMSFMMTAGSEVLGQASSLAKTMFGEQSKAYRVMFAMEKGMAIARSIMAIQTAMAQASANPFPMNLGAMATVASQVANIVSTIKSVAMPVGQAHDGIMSVPKSGTWNLEKGERVLPQHTAKNLDNTLNRLGSGGNNVTVNVTVNSDGNSSVEAKEGFGKRLGHAIKAAIQAELQKERRQGGLLYGR